MSLRLKVSEVVRGMRLAVWPHRPCDRRMAKLGTSHEDPLLRCAEMNPGRRGGSHMSHLSRRQFLYGSAAALSSLSLGRSLLWAAPEARPARLPRPERSGIDH